MKAENLRRVIIQYEEYKKMLELWNRWSISNEDDAIMWGYPQEALKYVDLKRINVRSLYKKALIEQRQKVINSGLELGDEDDIVDVAKTVLSSS